MIRPRCSILTGGFDFSGCGDFTSCPPVELAAMSNIEPSAIMLHGSACIGGLYISLIPMKKSGASRLALQHGRHGLSYGLWRPGKPGRLQPPQNREALPAQPSR